MDRLGFPEAVRVAGVPVSGHDPRRLPLDRSEDRRRRSSESVSAAHRFFHGRDSRNPATRRPRHRQERGVAPEIVMPSASDLPAPDSWGLAVARAAPRPHREPSPGSGGSPTPRPEGKRPVHHDRFRDRLIFVVRDEARGRSVRFGGRALAEDAEAGRPQLARATSSEEAPSLRVLRLAATRSPAGTGRPRRGGYFDHLALATCRESTRTRSLSMELPPDPGAGHEVEAPPAPKVIVCYDGDSAGRARGHAGGPRAAAGTGLAARIVRLRRASTRTTSCGSEGRRSRLPGSRRRRTT